MEILIYLDDEDKEQIKNLISQCKISKEVCEEAKTKFWYGMIDKYPYLRNKRIAFNSGYGYIFEWHSQADLVNHIGIDHDYYV